MTTHISPMAGKPAQPALLTDIPKLVTAYYTGLPDPTVPAQRVAFGTSGHRGSSLDLSFNEAHVLAITQAICDHRRRSGIDGPLFLGGDTHALSEPACASALEVLAANGVNVMLAPAGEYTPTPAVSHSIIKHNSSRGDASSGRADGIVITPSHNPPRDGGFKYNPPHGGPADDEITRAIQNEANALLESALTRIPRLPYARALRAATTHRHDFMGSYVSDLESVIDLDAIRNAAIHMGVDPLGGAGVHYWPRIAEQHRLDLTIVSEEVDPTFRFMSVDWDGKIRMDPSSRFAMQRLLALQDRFDIAFACDTDHDRHGIVTPRAGLLPPNHYMTVAIDYLFRHRSQWNAQAAIGKTIVSTALIDRVAARISRPLYEVPVGFKWFAPGLADGSLGFGGEESAGASFLRRDGKVWTTDKDGIAAALLSAEITAVCGVDPGDLYVNLTTTLGTVCADRIEAPATRQQKQRLAALTPQSLTASEMAGEKITQILTTAPANGAPIGGIKVITATGWFAARPSGTEDIYKIYAESFSSQQHLARLLQEAQAVVDRAIGAQDGPSRAAVS
ncbi:MAG: phosphoglucomutase (alpha-D-glucose-1,6-bisphosphate-dependent) [Pseudomonadota bacterium]